MPSENAIDARLAENLPVFHLSAEKFHLSAEKLHLSAENKSADQAENIVVFLTDATDCTRPREGVSRKGAVLREGTCGVPTLPGGLISIPATNPILSHAGWTAAARRNRVQCPCQGAAREPRSRCERRAQTQKAAYQRPFHQ